MIRTFKAFISMVLWLMILSASWYILLAVIPNVPRYLSTLYSKLVAYRERKQLERLYSLE